MFVLDVCWTDFLFVVWVYNFVICMFVCHTVVIRMFVCHTIFIRLFVCHCVGIRLNVSACTTVPTFVSLDLLYDHKHLLCGLGLSRTEFTRRISQYIPTYTLVPYMTEYILTPFLNICVFLHSDGGNPFNYR